MAAPAQPQQKKTLLMTEGSIWKSILLFSVPLILGNLLQQLYNTADSIIVGNFLGSNALAAVGSSGSPIYLLIGFSQGVAVGAGVVVSQYLGAKDKKETRIAVHTSLAIAVILGLILTVGGIAVSRSLLVWMNTPEEVLGDAVTYMKLYFGGVLFSVVYNMAAGILNAAGNSRRSVIYLACASITNIILDLVLIAGLKMGVAGAAIATDISQLVSCVLSLRFLMKVDADYKVELSAIRPDQRMTSRIIRIGLPTGIQNMVISFSNVLVQSSVNSYGAAAMAGFAAYMKIDGFNILPVTSFSMAATTFVGQNYGAGNLKRVKNGMWVTLGMSVLYTLCTGALLLAFQDPIMHLFTSDETVVAFGCSAMHYFCPFYFLLVSAVLNTGLDLLFVLKFGMGVEGVAYATIIAQAVSAALTIWVLMRTAGCIRVELRALRMTWSVLRQIVSVGIPAALQMAITAFSNVFVQGYINYFGPDCMSGWTAYTKVDQLVILPVQSIAMAGTTFVGQNLGVGDTARAKKGVRTALYLSFAVTAVLLVPVLLLAPDLTAFFNSKAEVVSYGALLLRLLSPFYFFFCINQIYSAALRGAGNSQVPMWIMLGSFVVFRQIYLYIVANYVSNEIIPIAMSYPAGWFVCSVATLIYYRFCKFDSHRLVEDV